MGGSLCGPGIALCAQVELVKTLGTTPAGPKVYVMTPPPLMSTNAGARPTRPRAVPHTS